MSVCGCVRMCACVCVALLFSHKHVSLALSLALSLYVCTVCVSACLCVRCVGRTEHPAPEFVQPQVELGPDIAVRPVSPQPQQRRLEPSARVLSF